MAKRIEQSFDFVVAGDELAGVCAAIAAALRGLKTHHERPACTSSRRISTIVGRTLSAETEIKLRASLFVDTAGDGVVADRAGCGCCIGVEGKGETGEPHAPENAPTAKMGDTVYIRAKDIARHAPIDQLPFCTQEPVG